MVKEPAKKKKKAAKEKAASDTEVNIENSVSVVSDFGIEVNAEDSISVHAAPEPVAVVVDDEPKAAGDQVSVGQRFWMVEKGHRRKAREVMVASMSPGGETVTVRFLGDGSTRKLPRTVFQTAGRFRLIRA